MISGNKFAIRIEPNTKTVTLIDCGSAKTLMVMGDKTGFSEIKIGFNGTVDYDSMVKLFESNAELFMILAAKKDFIAKVTFSKIDGDDFSARLLNKVRAAEYIGPAGGIIFYDKGEYSDGWRYLEAAPADLRVIAGVPSVDESNPWYDFGYDEIIFGYYRKSAYSDTLYVNGSTSYNEMNCTGTAVGTGRENTELLVKAMDNSGYQKVSDGADRTAVYAAKLCSDLVFNGFDDWFLPSKDELNLMYEHRSVIGGFADNWYWSSSEARYSTDDASRQNFGNSIQYSNRGSGLRVRPVRAF